MKNSSLLKRSVSHVTLRASTEVAQGAHWNRWGAHGQRGRKRARQRGRAQDRGHRDGESVEQGERRPGERRQEDHRESKKNRMG